MREPSLFVATGQKGVGKTHTTLEMTKVYTMNDTKIGRKARPVLCFDVNKEYKRYIAIDFNVEEQNPHKRGAQIRAVNRAKEYRILPIRKNGVPMTTNDYMEAILSIVTNFKNGLVILEDTNRYAGSNLKKDLVGAIIAARHLGLDVMLHYQSMAKIPPTVWENINYLRMHKQVDDITAYKGRIKANPELMRLAQLIVNKRHSEGDKYYYCWVHVMDNFMTRVDKSDFSFACKKYLSSERAELQRIINEYTEKGKKPTNEKAIELWTMQKMSEYLKT